jgi:hypothetical protein
MPTRTLLVRQHKHEGITLHDRRGSATPEKMAASRSGHDNCRSILRDSRRQPWAFLEFRFLVGKKYGH